MLALALGFMLAAQTARSPVLVPGVTMVPQRGAPATLLSLSYTTGRSFAGGDVQNNGLKVIVEVRLAWRILRKDAKPQIGSGAWVKMSPGIQPGKTANLPARAASLPPVSEQKERIEFFIGAVRFQDGTAWEEKPARLDEYFIPAQQPRR